MRREDLYGRELQYTMFDLQDFLSSLTVAPGRRSTSLVAVKSSLDLYLKMLFLVL